MAAIKSKNTHSEIFFASYYLPAACDIVQVHLRWEVFWIFGSLDIIQRFFGRVLNHGVVTWLDGELDIAPESMYENSYPYVARA